jgi:hypothetical protein
MNKLTIISITVIISLLGCKYEFRTSKKHQSYYLDSRTGNDSQPGTSPEKAWKSLQRIEGLKLEAGDKVYLSGNTHFPGRHTWRGQKSFRLLLVLTETAKQSLSREILRQ